MAALPLQVISIGTTTNFVVPTAAAAVRLSLVKQKSCWNHPLNSWHFGQRASSRCTGDPVKPHFPPLHLVTHGQELHPPFLLPEVPRAQPQWDVQRSGPDGHGAVCSDISKLGNSILSWFFLIKWVVLSSFISFLGESTLRAATHVPHGRK